MRSKLANGKAEIRALMTHPMQSGAMKDSAGKLIPAQFITEVTAVLNGTRTVLASRWSGAVSQDPFLSFRFGGAKAGDTLTISWKDNTGDSRSDTMTLA
jgi:sulfur-oxidizing protein SoxZ